MSRTSGTNHRSTKGIVKAGALWGSGPLIKRSFDAGTDRGETASSSGGAGSYAEGGGQACQRIPLDPVLPGVRQARSLHADRDEDRQGIRRALRGVGGGVASRTIPTAAPTSRFRGATPLRELRLYRILRTSPYARSPQSTGGRGSEFH